MEVGVQKLKRPIRAVAIAYGLAYLRGGIGLMCLMIAPENFVTVVYGVSEIIAAVLSLMNTHRAKAFDSSGLGLALPLCYCVGLFVVPVRVHPAPWFDAVAVVIALLRIGVVANFGSRYSNGVASWVALADRGPYAVVRHPQAALGLLLRLLFVIANPCAENYATGLLMLWCTLVGLLLEERFLVTKDAWREYSERVRWRLIPCVW